DSIAADFGPHDPAGIDLATALTLMPETRRLRWPVGRFSSYSNVGYGVAGRVLEVAGGAAYEDLMRREVFAPLGMTTATLRQTPEVVDYLVHGYDTDGITPLPYWHMLYRSFGAITINPGDMAPLIRLFLNRGRHAGRQLLAPASIRRIETPATGLAARSGLVYGYGLGNYASYYRGHLFHGHGGDADGYLAKFGYSHALGRGYFLVLTAFNKRAQQAMHDAVRDFVIGGTVAPAKPARYSHPDLDRFTGRFRPVTRRFGSWPPADDSGSIDVMLRGGRLYTRAGSGRLSELVPVNAMHFRRRNQAGATYAFIHEGGKLYLLGDLGNFVRAPVAMAAPAHAR
ncbi:MAG: beta-lactamase family protein, partial [Gammaproteobacteria bacterium]|nr:beta-lactamase family protein [Gammaproteobacteria bacterium]